jgi:predicted ATPase
VLIERDGEVHRLLGLLAQTAAGGGRLVFLGGEAGGGKTSLMSAVTAAVPGAVKVRWGAADSMTRAAALGAVIDALPEVDELVRAVGTDRIELFRRIRSLMVCGPTLLVLEDMHWADDVTLDFLRFIGRRMSGMSVLVVVTYRPEDVSRHHAFSVMMGDLAGTRRVDRIVLAPLSLAGVRTLLAGSSLRHDADRVHRLTAGNPFFLTEVVAAGSGLLPATIRDAVTARTARLSPSAYRALSAAAVLGRRADAQLIGEVAGEPIEAVDECVQHGLLVADGDDWAFRHELARLAVEESLLPGVKASLHASALRVLAAMDPSAHRVLAHHAAGAADFGRCSSTRRRRPPLRRGWGRTARPRRTTGWRCVRLAYRPQRAPSSMRRFLMSAI